MAAKSEKLGDIRDYLEELKVPFSLLGRTHYQSWHVGRVLSYYRLIVNRHQDAEVEQLLRYCIAPYLDFRQIDCLKEIAQKNEQPFIWKNVIQLNG